MGKPWVSSEEELPVVITVKRRWPGLITVLWFVDMQDVLRARPGTVSPLLLHIR